MTPTSRRTEIGTSSASATRRKVSNSLKVDRRKCADGSAELVTETPDSGAASSSAVISRSLLPTFESAVGVVAPESAAAAVDDDDFLRGVTALVEVVSGRENISSCVARELRRMGAVVVDRLSKRVTHVVFQDGRQVTFDRAVARSIPIVNVLWVDSCKRSRKCVAEDGFLVSGSDEAPSHLIYGGDQQAFRTTLPQPPAWKLPVTTESIERSMRKAERARQLRRIRAFVAPPQTDAPQPSPRASLRFDDLPPLTPADQVEQLARDLKMRAKATVGDDLSDDQTDDMLPLEVRVRERYPSLALKLALSVPPPPRSRCSARRSESVSERRSSGESSLTGVSVGSVRLLSRRGRSLDNLAHVGVNTSSESRSRLNADDSAAKPRIDAVVARMYGLELEDDDDDGAAESRTSTSADSDALLPRRLWQRLNAASQRPKSASRARRGDKLSTRAMRGQLTKKDMDHIFGVSGSTPPKRRRLTKPLPPMEAAATPTGRTAKRRYIVRTASHKVNSMQTGLPSAEDFDQSGAVGVLRRRRWAVRQRYGIAFTCVSVQAREVVASTIHQLGAFRIDSVVGVETTHLVCGDAKRTVNLLLAMARGCWILSHEWVYRSVESERWLPEAPFELAELYPAKRRCERVKGIENGLLGSVGPIYVSRTTAPPTADLCALVRAAGGNVCASVNRAALVIGCDPDRRSLGAAQPRMRVAEAWLLDSICEHSVQPTERYRIEELLL